MNEAFIGSIVIFAGNFAPRGWQLCNGQILSIAQNTALFSILGTTYGGNGQTTFALPDLRGRTPVSAGQGPGLRNYTLGEVTGSETVTLTVAQLAPHTHTVAPLVRTTAGDDTSPAGNKFLAPASTDLYADSSNANMGASPSSVTGSATPVNILQPLLCVNYIICMVGIFPSRN
jgi:microcystin-dependent protein